MVLVSQGAPLARRCTHTHTHTYYAVVAPSSSVVVVVVVGILNAWVSHSRTQTDDIRTHAGLTSTIIYTTAFAPANNQIIFIALISSIRRYIKGQQ